MNKLIALVFTAILLVESSFAHAATAWRTTYFEVFMGKPYENNDSTYMDAVRNGSDPDSSSNLCGWFGSEAGCEQVISELEAFLHELAIEFQNDGFPDPTIKEMNSIRTDDSGREVVRVYLYKFDEPAPGKPAILGGYRNKCDGSALRHVLEFNSAETISNGKVTDRGYQNAAHELFHAVQLASNFRKGFLGCKIGKWITEGTADAVGFDYAKKLRGIDFESWLGKSTVKPWGIRAYNEPLNKKWPKDDTSGYQTMSFWRHLAEWNFAKTKGKDHPGSAEAAADYRYLVELFATRQLGLGGEMELRWLDLWMKSYFPMHVGLAPVFAQFTSSFGGYGSTRLSTIGAVNKEKWPRGSFGGCTEVELDYFVPQPPENYFPTATVELDFNVAAARCISIVVNSDHNRPFEVSVQNSDLDKDAQKQLYLGKTGGLLVAHADPYLADEESPDNRKSFVLWRVLVAANTPNLFTVSNMASSVQNTKAISPALHFSIPNWEAKSEHPEAAKQKSSTTTSRGSSGMGEQPKQIETPGEVSNFQRKLRLSPTRQSSMAAMSAADFKPIASSCKPVDRANNLCGPQLVINLIKDYGMNPGQGPVGSTGGALKQMGALQQSDVTKSRDDADFMLQMQNLVQNNNKGEYITLSIPVIPYGSQTGTSVARIEVSNGTIDGVADSLVSVSIYPDQDGVYLPNGKVFIQEYTPHILRGNFFSDALVSRAEVREAEVSRSKPVLPIGGNIRGSFVVSAPWRGNGARPDTSLDSTMMTGMRNDMMDILMKMPEGMRGSLGGAQMREICKLEFTDQQLSTLGIGGSCSNSGGPGSVESSACNCDCGTWRQVQKHPACNTQCEPKWKTWQCGPYLKTGLENLDIETKRYQTELSQLDFSENEVNGMVYGFKIATPALREGIWKDLEQYKVQQAETNQPEQIAKIQAEQDKRGKNYDAETLRYSVALEQAGYSATEVAGLTEIFAPSPAVVRKVYWNEVNAKLNAKK